MEAVHAAVSKSLMNNNNNNNISNTITSRSLDSYIGNSNDDYILVCNHSTCYELEVENYPYAQFASASQVAMNFDFMLFMRFKCLMSWLSLVVILIGLVGNLVSFFILINPKMRISTNVFLSSLCVSGLIALIGLLLNSVVYDLFYYYNFYGGLNYLWIFYPYVYPIITTFQMSSIMLTVCVSLNQFIYIYFSATRQRTQKKSDKECRKALKVWIFFLTIGR